MSDDIYTHDPNRIIKHTTTGDVQAWAAPADQVSVNFNMYAYSKYRASKTAYVMQSLNLTAADARDLARALIEAADHADKVRIAEQEVA